MTQKGQPFFFDSHFFDPDDPRFTHADYKKPKLEYTQEQLRQAKESSFEAGKIAGFKDSQASLQQEVLKIVQKIDRDAAVLLAQEDARAHFFEGEVVQLCLAILKQIFPVLSRQVGFEDLKSFIADSLISQRERNIIRVLVHPDVRDAVQDFIHALPERPQDHLDVKPDASLSRLGCKILWGNGGITYDVEKIHDTIRTLLEESLAAHVRVQEEKK